MTQHSSETSSPLSDVARPRHVVVIPDGNRRWAHARGLDPWAGHDKGAARIEELATAARAAGVTYLSLWGSSMENLAKRPLKERAALIDVYERYFDKLLSDDAVTRDDVRIRVLGYWREALPSSLVRTLERGIAATAHHTTHHLTFFLNYSGDYEMLEAVRAIVAAGTAPSAISADTLKSHLLTADLPPVDFLIRTGGEPHLSAGFLMWDTANAQLHFDESLFPDFDATRFAAALDTYARRARRLGQ